MLDEMMFLVLGLLLIMLVITQWYAGTRDSYSCASFQPSWLVSAGRTLDSTTSLCNPIHDPAFPIVILLPSHNFDGSGKRDSA
jgi:hypothetical protein